MLKRGMLILGLTAMWLGLTVLRVLVQRGKEVLVLCWRI